MRSPVQQALKKLCSHFSISYAACNFKANVYDRSNGFMKGLRDGGVCEVTCWPHLKGASTKCTPRATMCIF